ncbi:MAG: hypothetical protein AAB884_01090 [Patescibacteria group bacterium]
MTILIVIISIFVIIAATLVINKLGFRICPICAGVAGTWLWILAAVFLGAFSPTDYQLPLGILMGGSVVGIAYQLEKRLNGNISPVTWKIIFIPLGFLAVYSLLSQMFLNFAVTIVLLLLMMGIFVINPKKKIHKESGKTKELEEKMEECC